MYAQQVFLALFTGVLNTIACVCRRGVGEVFQAGLQLAFVSSVRDSFGRGKCLPIFYRGLMCICCVRVHAHAHTLHVGYSDVSPVVGKRHLENPEEIQMYCSDSIPCSVRSTHAYIYAGIQIEVWTNCLFFFLTYFFFYKNEKKKMWAKPPISQIPNRFEHTDLQSRVLNYFL